MPGQSEEAGLLGLVEAEPERRSQRVAARQRARAGFGGGKGGWNRRSSLAQQTPTTPRLRHPIFTHLKVLPGSTTEYC